MKFIDTDIAGFKLIELGLREDERGSFARMFCRREMVAAGIDLDFVQVNHSRTTRAGSVRGLHFQHPPATETKIIRCIKGAVWDVAVDLRAGSSTFLQWRAVELREDRATMVVIPDGFAHGFQTLCDEAELIYFHSAFYSPEHEAGIHCLDPMLAIEWPLPITQQSERDRVLPCLTSGFEGLPLTSPSSP